MSTICKKGSHNFARKSQKKEATDVGKCFFFSHRSSFWPRNALQCLITFSICLGYVRKKMTELLR